MCDQKRAGVEMSYFNKAYIALSLKLTITVTHIVDEWWCSALKLNSMNVKYLCVTLPCTIYLVFLGVFVFLCLSLSFFFGT